MHVVYFATFISPRREDIFLLREKTSRYFASLKLLNLLYRAELETLKGKLFFYCNGIIGWLSIHGDGGNTGAPLSGWERRGWRKMYNVSRLNGSIVLSGKGRNIRLGELLNPPR